MTEINVKTLADFKRFLATPGATLRVIRNDWMDTSKTNMPLRPKEGYWEPKRVKTLQSNAVEFTTGSWLAFPKAAHIRCNGDTITICMNEDGTFAQELVYRLTIATV